MDAEQEGWDREILAYQPLLLLVARRMVSPRIWNEVDPSGVVQETLLEARQRPNGAERSGPPSPWAWVHRILLNNLHDKVRWVRAQKRNPDQQVRIDGPCDATERLIRLGLRAEGPTPSQEAMKNEELRALSEALVRLDPDQEKAVTLRHLHGCSLTELAAALGRSESAAAALLHRGLEKLKAFLRKA